MASRRVSASLLHSAELSGQTITIRSICSRKLKGHRRWWATCWCVEVGDWWTVELSASVLHSAGLSASPLQVAGWTERFKGLTFASIRGAGHKARAVVLLLLLLPLPLPLLLLALLIRLLPLL